MQTSTPAEAIPAAQAIPGLDTAAVQANTQTPAPTAYPTPVQERALGALPTTARTPTTAPTPSPTAEPSQNPRPAFTLSATVTGSGTLTQAPDQAAYLCGTAVTFRPVSMPGWSFAGWRGPNAADITHNQDGTWSLTMDDNKELTAAFAQDQYYVIAATEGLGTVATSPGEPYSHGQSATLTPLPRQGWTFVGWSGPDALLLIDNQDGSWSLTMDGNKNITAVLIPNEHLLAVKVDGQGTVTQAPERDSYPYGTVVTLRPIAIPGWSFAGWDGPQATDLTDHQDATWSVTTDSNKELTAVFVQNQYPFVIAIDGMGRVVQDPDQATYTYGTAVTLRPAGIPGWSFAGWSGPDAAELRDNQDGTWSLIIDGSDDLAATFTQDQYYVTIAIDGMGTVTNSPGNPYVYGQTAILTPLAKPGWRFDSWAGPDGLFVIESMNGTWSLTMDGNKEVTAIFGQDR